MNALIDPTTKVEIAGEEVVVPICFKDADGHLHPRGSSFFVGNDLLVTAKHVLEEDGKELRPDQVVAVHLFDALGECAIPRLVKSIFRSPGADAALVQLLGIRFNAEKQRVLRNRSLVLCFDAPQPEQPVLTCSYPRSDGRFVMDGQGRQWHEAHFLFAWSHGKFIKEHPCGFGVVKNHCWELELNIDGRSSGGPVFNQAGQVVGLLSSSMPGVYTVATSLSCLLETELTDILLNHADGHQEQCSSISFRDLAARGFIKLHSGTTSPVG